MNAGGVNTELFMILLRSGVHPEPGSNSPKKESVSVQSNFNLTIENY
jgi:hypothetical protein